MTKLPQVSEAELEVLRQLWDHGGCRVRELLALLPAGQWAFTTVQTLLHRLEQKGFVERERTAGGATYHAAVSKSALLARRLDDLARDLAGGSVVSAMHGFVTGRRWKARELAELRDLLDELEARAGQDQRRRRKS